jgi:glycerophosphoryl diester phosphodiesterase
MEQVMPLVIAHRGASAYAPENTMPAFELAVRQGADMLELDVQRSADGVLVVFHDDTTERWNGRARPVSMCTLAALRALDIGGARVATLAEVCSFARDRGAQLNVEIKALGIGAEVARMLRAERVEDLVLISSFADAALREVAAASPRLPRAYLMGNDTYRPDVRLREAWPFAALRDVGATAWHPASRLPLLAWLVPRVRRAGYRINVWTVDDVAEMRRMIALGVDGIITNRPDVLGSVIKAGRNDTLTR